MSRWIDADALAYKVIINGDADLINKVTKLMTEVPSIEIVFCKECKYWKKITDKDGDSWEVCNKHMIFTDADDFCSYGKVSEKPTGSEKPNNSND